MCVSQQTPALDEADQVEFGHPDARRDVLRERLSLNHLLFGADGPTTINLGAALLQLDHFHAERQCSEASAWLPKHFSPSGCAIGSLVLVAVDYFPSFGKLLGPASVVKLVQRALLRTADTCPLDDPYSLLSFKWSKCVHEVWSMLDSDTSEDAWREWRDHVTGAEPGRLINYLSPVPRPRSWWRTPLPIEAQVAFAGMSSYSFKRFCVFSATTIIAHAVMLPLWCFLHHYAVDGVYHEPPSFDAAVFVASAVGFKGETQPVPPTFWETVRAQPAIPMTTSRTQLAPAR